MTSQRTAPDTRWGPVTVDIAAHRESLRPRMSRAAVARRMRELGWPDEVTPSAILRWETGERRMPPAAVAYYAAAVRVDPASVNLPTATADDLATAEAS